MKGDASCIDMVHAMQPDACNPWPLSKLKDSHLTLASELTAVATGVLCTSAVGRPVRLQQSTWHLMTAGCPLAGVGAIRAVQSDVPKV